MQSTRMIEPAFPVHPAAHSRGDAECAALQGMSLRDWFAGQAMTAIISSSGVTPKVDLSEMPWVKQGIGYNAWAAEAAYRVADAMLAARAK